MSLFLLALEIMPGFPPFFRKFFSKYVFFIKKRAFQEHFITLLCAVNGNQARLLVSCFSTKIFCTMDYLLFVE